MASPRPTPAGPVRLRSEPRRRLRLAGAAGARDLCGRAVLEEVEDREHASQDEGRDPDPVTALVASLPRRLGLHLPR